MCTYVAFMSENISLSLHVQVMRLPHRFALFFIWCLLSFFFRYNSLLSISQLYCGVYAKCHTIERGWGWVGKAKKKKKISKRDSRDEKKGYDTLIKIYKQTCIKNEDFYLPYMLCFFFLRSFPFLPKYKSLVKYEHNI
jgi:hypothetical protein